MKICIVSDEFPPFRGGIASYSYGLANALTDVGYDVGIFTRKRLEMPSDSIDFNFRIVHYDDFYRRKSLLPLTLMRWLLCAKRYFEENGFNKIICVDPRNLIPMYIAKMLWGIDYDVVLHGSELLRYSSRWTQRAIYKNALFYATNLWTNSSYTNSLLKDLFSLDGKVVLCGVDREFFAPLQSDSLVSLRRKYRISDSCKVIGTIARLDKRKGQDLVIRAVAKLQLHVPNLKYIIGGSGPFEAELMHLVRELSLQDHVVFCGRIPHTELVQHYDLLDVFAIANRICDGNVEGFGISFAEATARQVPCVGVNNGGVSDVVVSGLNGRLIKDPPTVESMAEAITGELMVVRSIEQVREMKGLAEKFTWHRVASEMGLSGPGIS